MDSRPHNHAVRKIVLPSGRTIEVIRFRDSDVDAHPLHMCGECGSDLVQPIHWMEGSDGRWDLTLECPNCAWIESGTYSRDQVEELETWLDNGLAEMIADLQRLAQSNMAADVERFVTALQSDLILPEDF